MNKFIALLLFMSFELWALQGGPSQPDYLQFESSQMADMVNLSTGDFTYSIPLGELPSPYGNFPLSMSYHAGISPQQEASWVGLGWTLNPGVINRQIRGVPDDQFHGGTLGFSYSYSSFTSWMMDANFSIGVFSVGQQLSSTGGVGYSATIGPKASAFCDVGFTVGTNAVGLSGRLGPQNGVSLNASILFSTANGAASKNIGVSYENENVRASLGTNSFSGKNAAASVGFGNAEGSSKIGLTAGASGISASVRKDLLQMGVGTHSVSVNGASLAVSNTSGKNNQHVSSKAVGIILPFEFAVFSMGFQQSNYEFVQKTATSDYLYGYLYQAGPAIVADGKNEFSGMPNSTPGHENAGATSPWEWNIKGRTLEGLGAKEMHPAYDMYTVMAEGVSGAFRPYTREEHNLHKIISNQKTAESKIFEEYPTILEDSTDGWPYMNEFKTSSGIPITRNSENFYRSYQQCVHEDSCSLYALYSTRFRNEGNRFVYRKNKDVEDTLESGINFLFIGDGGFYESEQHEGAKNRIFGEVSDILLKRNINGRARALLGSRKVEPIFEDDSPVGKLQGFVITNPDGTRFYFQQPVKSYLTVDYSINQEKGTPVFVDQGISSNENFWENFGDAYFNFMVDVYTMYYQLASSAIDAIFKPGELKENCSVPKDGKSDDMFYSYNVNMNPHATQWLLTEIQGADFVKFGDSIQDNVGYNVKFHYTDPTIYRWRTPFTKPGTKASDVPNFRIQRNALTPEGCDSRLFQASFGVKELVYLKSIETSTHRVEFELNNLETEERVDGKGWDLSLSSNETVPPIFVQASVAFTSSIVSENDTVLFAFGQNIGNGNKYTSKKILLEPQWLYINTKAPEILLKRLAISKIPIKVFGFLSKPNPQYSKDVVDTMLYSLPDTMVFKIDSDSLMFEETKNEESRYGLYKIRIKIAGDSILVKQYIASQDSSFNRKTVVLGENGSIIQHPFIDWGALTLFKDSSDLAENRMRYLKKISYKKNGDSIPYKEFDFGYDYTLHPKTLNSYCSGLYPQSNDDIRNSPDSVGTGICTNSNLGNHLYGRLSLKSVTEKGCHSGRCAALPPFRFTYKSPQNTSTRLSTKEGWENLSQNISYDSVSDTIGTNQFPESYYANITDVDASIIASSNAIDEWGFWNDMANEENHKVRQNFADVGASSWSLSKITEPSGGVIEIDYERDSYENGEESGNEKKYIEFANADTCKKFDSKYGIAESDSSQACLELKPLYWKEQCLGPLAAFWDTERPIGFSGNGFEYLDSLNITKKGILDTNKTIFYSVTGNMGTNVKTGLLGLVKRSRTRSVTVFGDGVAKKMHSYGDTRVLVLDRSMAYIDAALKVAAKKINSSQNWFIKSKQGGLWPQKNASTTKGGSLRVKRLIRRDLDAVSKTEYEYENGEIAQLPDSAYNSTTNNRYQGSKAYYTLPDMNVKPMSRIVGFNDNDLLYLPGNSVSYSNVKVKNSDYNGTQSNGVTEFEFVSAETGIPTEYIDSVTRAALLPFLRVYPHLFVWGGNETKNENRPYFVEFSLLDDQKNLVGDKRKMVMHSEEITPFTIYAQNIREARYLVAESSYSMDTSLTEQSDTLSIDSTLSDFNDMDISITWYLGDHKIIYGSGYGSYNNRDVIKNNQSFVLHKSWQRSQKEGFYPILYKKIDYSKDSVTLWEIEGSFQAEKDQKDLADFDSSITYHDFTALLGLNIKTIFSRGQGERSIVVKMDSSVYSTRVPDVLENVTENTLSETIEKTGKRVERWNYERVLKCKDSEEDSDCKYQHTDLYVKKSKGEIKNFTYIRYPAYLVETISFTGYDNQLNDNRRLLIKSNLENHRFDPLTNSPKATLARIASENGTEMRKLSLSIPHYAITSGDTSLSNEMYRRNMLTQGFLSAVYSGKVDSASDWNSIETNDSLRSMQVNPYKILSNSNFAGNRNPIIAWGSFKSRIEPKDILHGNTLLQSTSKYQTVDSSRNFVMPPKNFYEGDEIDFVDKHYRLRQYHDDFGRFTTSHYSKNGDFITSLFFPARLSEVASVVPHAKSVSMTNCEIQSIEGYFIDTELLLQANGELKIKCFATSYDSSKALIAEYALRKSGRPWQTVREELKNNHFELQMYGGYQLSYLRIYPIDAQAKTFVYNNYGNMVRSIDEYNTTSYYEYTPLGHLSQIRNDDGVTFKNFHREYRNSKSEDKRGDDE